MMLRPTQAIWIPNTMLVHVTLLVAHFPTLQGMRTMSNWHYHRLSLHVPAFSPNPQVLPALSEPLEIFSAETAYARTFIILLIAVSLGW